MKFNLFKPPLWMRFFYPFFYVKRGLYDGIKSIVGDLSGDILDIGCGKKPYEDLFQSKKSYTGIDVEISGHNHESSKIDVFFDGKSLPFDNSAFDTVVMFEVIEHVEDLDFLLSEVRRVLRPGGFLIISCPFVWREHEVPYDFRRFTERGLINHISSYNFLPVVTKKLTKGDEAFVQILIGELHQAVRIFLGTFAYFFSIPIYFFLSISIKIITYPFMVNLSNNHAFYLTTLGTFKLQKLKDY